MRTISRSARALARGGALILALSAVSCGGTEPVEAPATAVTREAFITTYVELRAEAIRSGNSQIADDARAEILRSNKVTEEDLLAFVEVHGEDVDFMRGVWDEVEARLDGMRVDPLPTEGS